MAEATTDFVLNPSDDTPSIAPESRASVRPGAESTAGDRYVSRVAPHCLHEKRGAAGVARNGRQPIRKFV